VRWSNIFEQLARCILGGTLVKPKEPRYAPKDHKWEVTVEIDVMGDVRNVRLMLEVVEKAE